MLGTITKLITDTRSNGENTHTVIATEQPVSAEGDADSTYIADDELVERLVYHLEEGEISEVQRQTLREQLLPDAPNSIEARLGHLQSKMMQFEAYTAALEEFIDERGTAEAVLDDVRDDLNQATEHLESVQSEVDALSQGEETIREELASLDEAYEDIDEFVRSLKGRHEREIIGVDTKVEQLDHRVGDALADLSGDIEANTAALEYLYETAETVTKNEKHIDELSSLQEEVRELQEFEEDLDTLQHAVEELEAFRTTFIETISTPPTPGDG